MKSAVSINPAAHTMDGAPLTMNSLEIAELTGKRHDHVLRDIRAYVGAVIQMERGQDVRSLDWAGKEGVQVFGETPIGGVSCRLETHPQNGQQYPAYDLDKAATLTVVSGYNVILRKRIIDRWLELEAGQQKPMQTEIATMSDDVRRAIGGIVKGIVHKELVEAIQVVIPSMLVAAIAAQNVSVRHGKTSGQILRSFGYPPIKGLAAWFGNRLAAFGCRIENDGCGELGLMKARLFDPDKAEHYLTNGGRSAVEHKIAERRGQGKLRLV